MTRAEALAALIARVEAGNLARPSDTWALSLAIPEVNPGAVADAYRGSLDAVARLEAPLRERQPWPWQGPDVAAPAYYDGRQHGWIAEWCEGPLSPVDKWPRGEAPDEPRARLLAVLRALHHEAGQ